MSALAEIQDALKAGLAELRSVAPDRVPDLSNSEILVLAAHVFSVSSARPRFLTVEDLATRWGRPASTLYKWALEERIPAQKINGCRVFPIEAIEEFERTGGTRPVRREKKPSISRFQEVRGRLCSLKTEHTVTRLADSGKGA